MLAGERPQVLVIGAGPVGLFAALRLARAGVRVAVVDREWRRGTHSYALALHARSLALLGEPGVGKRLLERAYRVHTLGLYDGVSRRGEVHLSALEEEFPFSAVIGQDELEALLESALRESGVPVLWNHEVSRLRQGPNSVVVTVDRMERESLGYAAARTDWVVARSDELEVPFVIGADGHRSRVRRLLGLDFPQVGEAESFALFEFRTETDLGHEARLVLDRRATSVLWPLPDGYCRWSFQLAGVDGAEAARAKDRLLVQLGTTGYPVLSMDELRRLMAERAPWFDGGIDQVAWRIVVRFERRLAGSFGQGRVWLVGDAGHMTGPVGVQSMNVGLREAGRLAEIVAAVLAGEQSPVRLAAWGKGRLAEWRQLLGLEGGLSPGPKTPDWLRPYGDRLLSCLPASGDSLARLAGQLGFGL